MPEAGFSAPRALERAVMSYYEGRATEENRTCLAPYMHGLTRVEVVDEQPDRLVIDVRYLYRDRNKDDRGVVWARSAPPTASAASRSAKTRRVSRWTR
jgi:hypothetical protein